MTIRITTISWLFTTTWNTFVKKIPNKLKALKRIDHNQIRFIYNSFLGDSLATSLLFGSFVLGVQISLLTTLRMSTKDSS